MTISRVENACKPLILPGLQKKFKKISTHLLTVLTITAIFLLEHENQVVSADLPSLPDQSYESGRYRADFNEGGNSHEY